MAGLSLERVSKHYGPIAAVDDVSLSVADGEFLVLLGPSGCGKTTTLRMIAGFVEPSAGTIRLGERVVTRLPPWKRNAGLVFQSYALFPHLTAAQNVAFGLEMRKLGRAEIAERVGDALALVRLAGYEDRLPRQLSGGQQQRVALARAIAIRPDVLLLDEPLSNLDAKIRIQVRAEIRRLQKELGITTVYVTHDQEEALTLSDRIAVFNQGKIFQVGAPRDLYERPADRFVADFIGINNLIEGAVRSVDAARGRLTAQTALGELQALRGERLAAGDRCVICIRPENIVLGEGAEGNFVRGKIAFAAYLGNTLRYDVDLGQGVTFKADIRDPWHHEQLAMGSAVGLSFPVGSTLAIPAS